MGKKRWSCYVLCGILIFLTGCIRHTAEIPTYTLLVSSPLEALPFSLPKENKLQHINWQVIVDGDGTLDERLSRHQVDFYFVDFFQYYDMHDQESQFIHDQAILANLIDYKLVIRKSMEKRAYKEWRMGFTAGSITDYLLDYWLEKEPIQRVQIRDEQQALELLNEGLLDGAVLRSSYAEELQNTNEFVILHSSLDDALYLNILLAKQSTDDDLRAKIIHDYRIGLSSYQQDSTLLDKWGVSPRLRDELMNMNEIEPFLDPDLFEKMRIWRLIHVPYSPSWSYESLMWLPKDNLISD